MLEESDLALGSDLGSASVSLVFESRGGSGEKRKTAFPGVRVEFARGDADSHILDIVRRSRTPRDLLVVTSDRRLAEQARDLGARTEDNAAFWKRSATRVTARAAAGSSRRPDPGRKLSPLEVELWERAFRSRKKKDDDF